MKKLKAHSQPSYKKYFPLVIFLVLTGMVGAFYLGRNTIPSDIKQRNTSSISPTLLPTPTQKELNSIDHIIEISNRTGWITYTNNQLGISFQYPVSKLELRQTNNEIPGQGFEVSLYSKQKDFENNPIKLLSVSDSFHPLTYDTQQKTTEFERFTIKGKKYDAEKYIIGEGSQCGGGSVETTLVKLKENLIIYKLKQSTHRNKDRQNCTSNDYDTLTTATQDLTLADEIIETITLKK
jgi:hypothetical protein